MLVASLTTFKVVRVTIYKHFITEKGLSYDGPFFIKRHIRT